MTRKIINYTSLVLGIFSFILLAIINSEYNTDGAGTYVPSKSMNFAIESFIVITTILLIITLGAILVFFIQKLIKNKKSLMNFLYLLIGYVILTVICYAFSDSTPVANSTENAAAITDTLLFTFYFAIISAIGTMIFFAVKKFFLK